MCPEPFAVVTVLPEWFLLIIIVKCPADSLYEPV